MFRFNHVKINLRLYFCNLPCGLAAADTTLGIELLNLFLHLGDTLVDEGDLLLQVGVADNELLAVEVSGAGGGTRG